MKYYLNFDIAVNFWPNHKKAIAIEIVDSSAHYMSIRIAKTFQNRYDNLKHEILWWYIIGGNAIDKNHLCLGYCYYYSFFFVHSSLRKSRKNPQLLGSSIVQLESTFNFRSSPCHYVVCVCVLIFKY